MLYRVIGPMGAKKRETLLLEAKRALEAGKRVYFLTPEQNTAECEIALIRLCGPHASLAVEVTNFSRLPNVVARQVGGLAGETPTEEEERLLFSVCLADQKNALHRLSVKDKPEEISALWAEWEQLRLSGLDAAHMARLAADEERVELKEKLEDAALVLSSYRELLSRRYACASTQEERLLKVLDRTPFFRDSVVLVDGFWDFTAPQERILERILAQSEACFVSFVTTPEKDPLFRVGYRAAQRVLRMARQNKIPVRDVILPAPQEEGEIVHLKKHVLKTAAARQEIPRHIHVLAAPSVAEEAEAVVSAVYRLALQGAKWSEIAILSRNGEAEEYLRLSLEQNGIPAFIEEKKPLAREPLARTVLLAAAMALGEADGDDLSQYLLNGVFSASEEERLAAEAYATTWGLSPRAFLSDIPFTMNPRGYERSVSSDENTLRLVNKAKETVFAPLRRLSYWLARGTNEERVTHLIAFLQEVGAEKQMLSAAEKKKKQGDYAAAGEICRVWNTVLERLSALVRAVGDRQDEPCRFLSLLRLALSGDLPGEVPPAQDRVFVGRVNFARPADTKYLFLMRMNSGVFPAEESRGGYFSPAERETLAKRSDCPLNCGDDARYAENFYFYLALSYAKQDVFFSYCNGSNQAPSLFIKRIFSLYPALKEEMKKPLPRISTPEQVFRGWLRGTGKSEEEKTLEEIFLSNPEYRLRALNGVAARSFSAAEHHLLKERIWAHSQISLSSSRIEKYVQCPYAFFAENCLKATPTRRARMAPNIVGTFIHNVLENFFVELKRDGVKLGDVSDEEIKTRIDRLSRQETQESFPYLSGAKVESLVRRATTDVVRIVKNLKEEFSVSRFAPAFFELDIETLGNEKDGLGWRIPLPEGGGILLRGKIDRVDQYVDEDGTPYVRVVDYKTGGHKFSLKDVANGLSLQMLLYLFSLWEKGVPDGEGGSVPVQPAGVLYLNGQTDVKNCSGPVEREKEKKNPQHVERKGLFVDDDRLLAAADPFDGKQWLPVSWKNKSSKEKNSLITLSRLGKIKSKLEKDIASLAEKMQEGRIEPLPLKGDDVRCQQCNFKRICKHDPNVCRPYQDNFEQILFGEEENHGEREEN